MKKFLMTLVSLSFVGSAAMAFEGVLVPTQDGTVKVHALKTNCEQQPQPASVESSDYCKPSGNSCPVGYDQYAKLCWGGWHHGFYKCGISCKKHEVCGWNPHGDYRCGNPGTGGIRQAANYAGVLQLDNNGDVVLQPASVKADGLNCTPPQKVMHKYCFGGWKKPLYRCGYTCAEPTHGGDGN